MDPLKPNKEVAVDFRDAIRWLLAHPNASPEDAMLALTQKST
jgi:hypothetical protein